MIRRIVLFFSFVLPGALAAQPLSQTVLRTLLSAQDLRDTRQLQSFLLDSIPAVRAQAAFAAGSVQDPLLVPHLLSRLNDHESEVRKAGAFALGQMNFVVDSTQRRTISAALIARLELEVDENVQIRIIEGLGKVGDALSLNMLVEDAVGLKSNAVKGEAALSIGRYAYRGIKSPEATQFAAGVLTGQYNSERWKAANALFRIGERGLLKPHADILIKSSTDDDANVRMYVASTLGKILTSSNLDPLVHLADSDTDWRVRVNAIKALATLDTSTSSHIMKLMIRAFSDSNEHISLAALSAVASKGPGQFEEGHPCVAALKRIISYASGRYSPRQRREAAIGLARLRGQTAYAVLSEQLNRGMLLKDTFIEALGFVSTEQAFLEVLEYLRQSNPRTRRLAVESALNIARNTHIASTSVNAARSAIVDCLTSDDAALIVTAASTLAESLFVDISSAPHLLGALQRLKSEDNAESMNAIIQSLAALKADGAAATLTNLMNDKDHSVAIEAATALEKITGSSYKQMLLPQTKPAYTNFDWTLLEEIKKNPVIHVKTSRGSLTITMLPDEAPFTCINFASLIMRGFFNGLVFHRVVANFVAQGGDPHGDGWGGPGYAIRSEFGYKHYERGTVGVASSGKDTEGSQFFVTHSHQPHLDGRYTIFGKVTSGMDVVEAIQVGDTIERIELSRGEGDRRD